MNNYEMISNKEILSFKEACAYLDVSESFLYKATSKRAIRFSKPNGGKIYFQRRDLNEWMMQNTQESVQDRMDKLNNYMKGGNHGQ